MRNISLNYSAQIFLQTGVYHIAMIGVDQKLAHLKEPFQLVQSNLKNRWLKWDEAQNNSLIAMAMRNYSDFELDQEVRRFELTLQKFVDKDKKSPAYKKFFPSGLSSVVTQPIAGEIESVKIIEENIADSSLTVDLKSYWQTLKEKREVMQNAIEAYNAALRAEGAAMVELKLAKEAWQRQYQMNYGEILKTYPGNKTRVESYFKKIFLKNEENEDDSAETDTETNV